MCWAVKRKVENAKLQSCLFLPYLCLHASLTMNCTVLKGAVSRKEGTASARPLNTSVP